MAGCRSRALPRGKAAKAPREIEHSSCWPRCYAPHCPGRWGPAGRSECGVRPAHAHPELALARNSRWPGTRAGPELALARNSRWPGTRAGQELALARNSRWPGTRAGPELALAGKHRPRLSLHTSSQAEGADSGLGQPRKGLPQCSGGLKGSSSAAKVGAQAEEAPRASEGCEDCRHTVTSQSKINPN
ncbi:uncharacterized protein LOC134810350 [Pan troglodytes]|uniref:uncharacterized protein LOC134810350 n=1 Tax=Pan troglodytes TaxID=9598 RepID=UPI0030137DED